MLTERQKEIIKFIEDKINEVGYPPSVREICKGVGLSSTSTVHSHLTKLEKLGYIRRDPTKPRAMEVIGSRKKKSSVLEDSNDKPTNTYTGDNSPIPKNYQSVPLVGQVTAGMPILAEENIQDYYPLPFDFLASGEEGFMLKVRGDSMIDAGIYDGDLVVVKKQESANNGEVVVALLEDEATVKRFYKENSTIRLEPENPSHSPIYSKDVKVLGKVVGLYRKF
ncbi:LexA repressor [Natranaerofaba carboxydovora]|nr:LexA repressor [Natranaerofaba carboxydovora]